MVKKIWLRLVCIVLILVMAISLNSFAVTVLNQDESLVVPIYGSMDTIAEAQAVDMQLTANDSKAVLSEDQKKGAFSLKVIVKDEVSNPYAEYTLVHSDAFNIDSFSTIQLWVKPSAGSNWIEFYTNGVLITCDMNKDGRFEVGTDLQSGKWSQVILDLLNTETVITQGNDLTVRTNENSIWLYDDVTSAKTTVTSIDLSTMVNDRTQINNGNLKFKKTTEETSYDTTPTVLVSDDRVVFEEKYTSNLDFTGGSLGTGVTLSAGEILFNYTNICRGGTAISDPNAYRPELAFDNDLSSYWSSPQEGTTVKGNANIGYDFKTEKKLMGMSIIQACNASVSSVNLQYYDEASSTWITTFTFLLSITSEKQIFIFDSNISAQKWRLLANSNTQSGPWALSKIEFFEAYQSYASKSINISTSQQIEYGKIDWVASENTKLLVETSLSLDGGITWGNWYKPNANATIQGINSNTNLQNARLKYRVSVEDFRGGATPALEELTVCLVRDNHAVSFLEGNLRGISIDTQYSDPSGQVATLYDKVTYYDVNSSVSVFALSGDGNTLYYANPDDSNRLYKLNILTGLNTKISDDITDIISLVTTYDGTKACVYGKYGGHPYSLIKYDSTATTEISVVRMNFENNNTTSLYDIQNDGAIVYLCSSSTSINFYSSTGVSKSIPTPYSSGAKLAILKDKQKIFYSYTSNNIIYICLYEIKENNISSNIVYEIPYRAPGYIKNIVVNSSGDEIFYLFDTGIYGYNLNTKVERKLNVTASFLYKMVDGDKLVMRESSRNYFIYDPATDTKKDIYPSDFTGWSPMTFDIDYSGNKIMYYPSNQGRMRVWYRNGETNKNRYLLSFDGKNTWYSYKDGSWKIVEESAKPSPSTLLEFGMTESEIRTISAADFSKLYENGAEIYTVDVAVYFASISPFITPSINSIKIVTDEGILNSSNNNSATLYAAKSVDFSGSTWRKVNRLYPIEISPKDAAFLFFIYANGKYQYYDGSAWHIETGTEITDLIADTEANWTKLMQIGMTAQKLRAISAYELTSQLAKKDFSVVYCMKITDESTVGYYSKISADYTIDLFSSSNLTLSITMSDGTIKQITGLTDTQIESFLEWLSGQQYNKGSIFYTIKTGAISYFINYYMIQSITVEEN